MAQKDFGIAASAIDIRRGIEHDFVLEATEHEAILECNYSADCGGKYLRNGSISSSDSRLFAGNPPARCEATYGR